MDTEHRAGQFEGPYLVKRAATDSVAVMQMRAGGGGGARSLFGPGEHALRTGGDVRLPPALLVLVQGERLTPELGETRLRDERRSVRRRSVRRVRG